MNIGVMNERLKHLGIDSGYGGVEQGNIVRCNKISNVFQYHSWILVSS